MGEGTEQALHVLRQSAVKTHGIAVHGMLKAKMSGVQRLPAERGQSLPCSLGELTGAGGKVGAIDGISQKRVADMGHVDADLVSTAGLQNTAHEARDRNSRTFGQGLQDFVVRNRMFALAHHGHLLPIGLLASQRGIDRSLAPFRHSPHNRLIGTLHASVPPMGRELLTEAGMRLICLGDHHEAGGLLVEPVNDTGAAHTANAGEAVAAMGDKGVDQGAGPVTGSRMHDQPGRLVDYNDLIVLKNHIKRNVFAARDRILRFGNNDGDPFARFDPVVRLQYLHAVRGSLTLLHQGLVAASAEFGEFETQEAINAVTGVFISNRDSADGVAHWGIGAMSDSSDSGRAPEPAGPAIPENPLGTPKNMRRLKLSIAIMSVLLVAGTLVVIGTIIYRAMNYEGNRVAKTPDRVSPNLQGFTTLDVEMDPGTLVTQIEIDGDRMAVHVTRASADEILLINIRSGELIGRVNLKERKPSPRSE